MAKRLTAKQLGITPDERKALIKVRDGLASGKYLHRSRPNPARPATKPIFNMNYAYEKWHCGTAGCIGGWMAKAMRREPDKYVGNGGVAGNLRPLFWPANSDAGCLNDITPKQAVRAIDNFLETGTDKPWARRKRAA